MAWQSASFSDAEDAGPALVTVQLSAASGFTIAATYVITNGTATAPADYIAASGTLTFAPGETSKTINITTVNDALQEGDESVTLTLSSPTSSSLGVPNPATLTIIDDETPAPPPSEEFYTYDRIGNLFSKTGVGAYSYAPQSALCAQGALSKRHAVTTAGTASYCYDQNGNLTSAGGQLTAWDAENRPSRAADYPGSPEERGCRRPGGLPASPVPPVVTSAPGTSGICLFGSDGKDGRAQPPCDRD